MKVKILFFALLKEKLRQEKIEVDLIPGENVSQLAHRVLSGFFAEDTIEDYLMFAVDDRYVDRNYLPHEGDEIAMIPPVAGG